MMTNDDDSVVYDYGDDGNDDHNCPLARAPPRRAARARGPPLWRAGGRGGEPERRDGRWRWLIMMIIMMMMMMMEYADDDDGI